MSINKLQAIVRTVEKVTAMYSCGKINREGLFTLRMSTLERHYLMISLDNVDKNKKIAAA